MEDLLRAMPTNDGPDARDGRKICDVFRDDMDVSEVHRNLVGKTLLFPIETVPHMK